MSAYRTPSALRSLFGILAHGLGLFLLPFGVGFAASLAFEIGEVRETSTTLLALLALFVLPPLVLQLLGIAIKVARERQLLRAEGLSGVPILLHTIHRHMRIVTPRGWGALVTGLWFAVLALWAKWADLGVLAVLALLLFYLVLGATSFVSTFLVRSFERGIGRNGSSIVRQMAPAVVRQGEAADEQFVLRRIPVPPGFVLLIEDDNLERLRTESRYAIGPGVRRETVTVAGRMRATPRGLHRLGPARIAYQDILGLTRVTVASVATAELKVLPQFVPLEIVDPPRSRMAAADVLARPHRFATEDPFRFREYAAGDDTRRIHWRLSIRAGRIHVRVPETKETSARTVLLVLDTHLPKAQVGDARVGLHEVLDRLVETWISVGHELLERGDRVTLVTAAPDVNGAVGIEVLATRDLRRWQDVGARAVWQELHDLRTLVTRGGASHAVIVTSRFEAPPIDLGGHDTVSWIFLPPLTALQAAPLTFPEVLAGRGPGLARRLLTGAFLLPAPAGSDDNTLASQVRTVLERYRTDRARARLRVHLAREGERAFKSILARGDALYRVEPGPFGHRLVGVQARRAARAA